MGSKRASSGQTSTSAYNSQLRIINEIRVHKKLNELEINPF